MCEFKANPHISEMSVVKFILSGAAHSIAVTAPISTVNVIKMVGDGVYTCGV